MNDDLDFVMGSSGLDIDIPAKDTVPNYDDDGEGAKTRFGNPFEAPAPVGDSTESGNRKYPPLFAALAVVYRKNLTGVLSARRNGSDVLSATVEKGRVVSVAHVDLDSNTIPDLLVETGMVSERHYHAAERKASQRNTSIEVELVKAGRISMVTAQNLLEATLTELMLQAMAERDLEFTFFKYIPAGLRRNCSLPIPFLLKEVQRRANEMPGIRAHFRDDSLAFVRTTQLESEPVEYLWEDLDLGAAEKQTYFFVDGRRTIDDLVNATSQSRFAVMRSLAALMDAGYVVSTVDPPERGKTNHTFWNLLRSVTLLAVIGLMGAGLWYSVSQDRIPRVSMRYGLRMAAYGSTIMDSVRDRVRGAILSYYLANPKDEISTDDLLHEGLIRANDVKVADQILSDALTEQAEADKARKTEILRAIQEREAAEAARTPDVSNGAKGVDDAKSPSDARNADDAK